MVVLVLANVRRVTLVRSHIRYEQHLSKVLQCLGQDKVALEPRTVAWM